MAKLARQLARKLEKSAQSQEPIDGIEVARDVTARACSVKFELSASLTTDTAVCPIGGTVPTTPIIGKDLLTDIPDPPLCLPMAPISVGDVELARVGLRPRDARQGAAAHRTATTTRHRHMAPSTAMTRRTCLIRLHTYSQASRRNVARSVKSESESKARFARSSLFS